MNPSSIRPDDRGALSREGTQSIRIERVGGEELVSTEDGVAVEEPLEIRIQWGPKGRRTQRALSVTMRTPGHDRELAAGFLYGEGILRSPDQLEGIHPCGEPPPGRSTPNTVRVDLASEIEFDLEGVTNSRRNFVSNSSCGVCGKESLEALAFRVCSTFPSDTPRVDRGLIHELPDRLLRRQVLFESTGGLHAAGLFSPEGDLVQAGEDVGRHNAVDKVIGRMFLEGKTPLTNFILVVSGRTSFEILQKALGAGIPFVVAVGAPSSLAVELAVKYGLTLVGFARNGGYNIYSGAQRIVGGSSLATAVDPGGSES